MPWLYSASCFKRRERYNSVMGAAVRAGLVVVAIATVVTASRGATAEGNDDARWGYGLSLRLGTWDASGVGVRLGTPAVGGVLAAGYVPVLTNYRAPGGTDSRLALLSTGQLAASLELRFLHMTRGTDIGATAGWRYDTLLGHGAGLGVYARVPFSAESALEIAGGPIYYPQGWNGVSGAVPSGASVSTLDSSLQIGTEIALVWSPLAAR